MLGHQSAVLTMDTYADLFPDDLELVSAALDKARGAALGFTADHLRTETEKGPDQNYWSGPVICDDASRGGGIRTHDLFVPNADSMYQDWSASAIELHRCDRQWCRVPRRIDLSAASLLPIDLLIRRHGRMV
jgi:hypothetical protein